MTTTRDFPLNVVVSVVKNRLVAPFEDYRAFLDYMTGEHVPLWDIETARRGVSHYLGTRFKELRKMPDPPEKTDSGNAAKYVRDVIKTVGYDHIPVAPKRVPLTTRTLTEALK